MKEQIYVTSPASIKLCFETEKQFTAWLMEEEPLTRLSKAIACELEPIEAEIRIQHGFADYLCHDAKSGSLVVIESIFGTADMDHMGRLMRYANELCANTAVLVAQKFPAEIKQLCASLNAKQTKQCKFNLVEALIGCVDKDSYCCTLREAQSLEVRVVTMATNVVIGVSSYASSTRIIRKNINELISLVRKAGLLNKTKKVVCPESDLGQIVKTKKPLQIVFWPATVDVALMAKTVAQALQNPKDELVIVASYLSESIRSCITDIVSLNRIAVNLFELTTKAHTYVIKYCDIDTIVQEYQQTTKFEKTIRFWQEVASLVKNSWKNQQRISPWSSSYGFGYTTTRRGVRIVSFLGKKEDECFEVRIFNQEDVLSRNQYEQLKNHKEAIENKLSNDFEVQWLRNQVRANQYVLRIKNKTKLFGDVKGYAQASIQVDQALQEPIRAMEDFQW